MADKLERLKATRGANRGVITRKIGEVDEILGTGGTLSSHQVTQLDILNRLLENKFELGEDLDQGVLSLCDLEAIQGEIEESQKVLERVVACQKRIQDALRNHIDEVAQVNTNQPVPVFAQLILK